MLIDRLMRRIAVQSDDCWLWTGACSNGYGVISVGGRAGGMQRVHRLTYEHFIGPIPEGLELDHLCRNRSCANPAHLEPVSHRTNLRRAMKTHCIHGHPFSPENTYLTPAGKRFCRECGHRRDAEYRARHIA